MLHAVGKTGPQLVFAVSCCPCLPFSFSNRIEDPPARLLSDRPSASCNPNWRRSAQYKNRPWRNCPTEPATVKCVPNTSVRIDPTWHGPLECWFPLRLADFLRGILVDPLSVWRPGIVLSAG